jgi:hypothetical protein
MKLRALIAAAAVAVLPATSQADEIYRSLPSEAKKVIEETRAACKEVEMPVTSGDEGLAKFKLGGKQAVLIDQYLLCGGSCSAGVNCSNRGTRTVEVYMLEGGRWLKVLSDDEISITGDIFISTKPGKREDFNALVVTLYTGNKDCPTRTMPSASAQSWEARDCVIRWNGSKFIFKPL